MHDLLVRSRIFGSMWKSILKIVISTGRWNFKVQWEKRKLGGNLGMQFFSHRLRFFFVESEKFQGTFDFLQRVKIWNFSGKENSL